MASPDPFSLDGRVAIVTGASSGLGAQFARALKGAGAEVVIAARRRDRLEALADDLGALAVQCDVLVADDREHLLEKALKLSGRLDVLVNNAGISNSQPAEEEPVDVFRQVIEVNLVAQFALAQLAGRQMLKQGSGSIVNVASVLGLTAVGQIPEAAYVSSKHGVVGMTRELAAQWARRGVRVNAIAPGWFESEMTAAMFADERSMKWVQRKTPMGRAGQEGELNGALLFLASDASSYVTGQAIAVDGGITAV